MPINNIQLAKFEITLVAQDKPFTVSGNLGSTLRGLLGEGLKEVCCQDFSQSCDGCLVLAQCPYNFIFQNLGREKAVAGAAPLPYLITIPEHIGINNQQVLTRIRFGLTIFGKAISLFPFFVYALQRGQQKGIGRRRSPYKVSNVIGLDITTGQRWQLLQGETVLNRPFIISGSWFKERAATIKTSSVTVEFLTPFRVKTKGELTDVIDFRIFLGSLIRRIQGLQNYAESDYSWNGEELIYAAEIIQTESDELSWVDWERYSSRQQSRLKIGGLLGKIRFSGDISPFIPLLLFGEHIHAGKQATFGLGQYHCLWHY